MHKIYKHKIVCIINNIMLIECSIYDDDMVTVQDVVKALSQCVDPELNANIVDLGLIYDIKITDGKDIKVKLTMTSPMCPVTSIILADAQLRLEALKTGGKIELELVWDPAWNPDMMSDALKYRD
jgi:metal-sulfur cluster biosynthetic enzyme